MWCAWEEKRISQSKIWYSVTEQTPYVRGKKKSREVSIIKNQDKVDDACAIHFVLFIYQNIGM